MKKLIYIFFLTTLFINYSQAQQCTEPDASIWKDTWVSCDKTANPKAEYGNSHWIQYDFGSVRNLSKTWVWNTNDPARLNQGFNLVKIDYSEDGASWTSAGEMNFPKASGAAVYSGFSGPDLMNIKAQYVLITAISNHGDATCAGIAEIKFNLLPEEGVAIPPTDEAPSDDEPDDENNLDLCALIEEIDLSEFMEVEAEFTEAFLFLEIEEEIAELPLFFEYRTTETEWQSIEIKAEEMVLEDLTPGTTYEYRVSIQCGDELNSTPTRSFETLACNTIGEISIEEVTETEAFFLWSAMEHQEFYLIEIGVANEEKEEWEVEEAELYLEELESNTTYELRVGTECGEDIIWSATIEFTTAVADGDLSTSTSNRLSLPSKQVHLFPNPTPGQLTVRIKTTKKDVLNYSISDTQGRILFRNVTKLHNGTNDLSLDLSNLTDGTYWLNGVTLNQRGQVSQQILKISK